MMTILAGPDLNIENIAKECQENKCYAIVVILAAGMSLSAYFFMEERNLFCEMVNMKLPVTKEWLKRVKEIKFRPLL